MQKLLCAQIMEICKCMFAISMIEPCLLYIFHLLHLSQAPTSHFEEVLLSYKTIVSVLQNLKDKRNLRFHSFKPVMTTSCSHSCVVFLLRWELRDPPDTTPLPNLSDIIRCCYAVFSVYPNLLIQFIWGCSSGAKLRAAPPPLPTAKLF